jgi:penicillin-binding protein 2
VDTGAAVVLDVRTGEVRAILSRPSFDPNQVDHAVPVQAQAGASEIDRALMEPEIPGSVLRPFSALAALRAGEAGPVSCPGILSYGWHTFRCTRAHGTVDLHHALQDRCNVWLWRQAERVGLDVLATEAQRFGLGVPTGIGIGREAEGLVPTRAWYDRHEPGTFRLAYTLNAAIGQGDVRVTPIQVAVAYAALANGGTVLEPRVVAGGAPVAKRTVDVRADDLARVRAALRDSPLGPAAAGILAHAPRPSGSRAAAGGSDVPMTEDTWFAGFAPADAPVVAVVIHGKGAGKDQVQAIAAATIHAALEGGSR